MPLRMTRTKIEVEELKIGPLKGKAPFEDYQYQDLVRVYNRSYIGLRHGMGLGKGYITISAINEMRKRRGIKKVLYLTSGSGVYNLWKEFQVFSDIPVERIAIGGVKNRRPFDQDVDIILCSHRSFLLMSDEYQKDKDPKVKSYRTTPIPILKWLGEDAGILVVDECHFMNNMKARQTKALHLISDNFKYIYPASGTPADKPEKWYALLKLMDYDLVHNKNYYDWLAEYAILGTQYSDWAIKYFKPSKLQELNEIVSQNWISRTADDCLILPDHHVKNVFVPFDEKHKAIYQLFVNLNITAIREEMQFIDPNYMFTKFPFFMLAIENPEMILSRMEYLIEKLPEEDIIKLTALINKFDFEKHHSKIPVLKELLEEHEDSKIIIWTYHPSTAEHIASLLDKKHPYIIHGETKLPRGMSRDEFKDQMITEFQASKTRNILIAGIPVLNSSVSIVKANVQIYFENTFNFTDTSQSSKRIYRPKQEKEVYTYNLIIDKSINVSQYDNIEGKDTFNKNFGSKDYMDLTDLKKLFNVEGK